MFRSKLVISGMNEEVSIFDFTDVLEDFTDPVPEIRNGPLGGFSEQRLEF